MEDDIEDDAELSAAVAAAERSAAAAPKVQQPKPQVLASRTGPSSVLVSTRQKGNPVLNNIRAMPWEYSDIPADFVLGATTCALFLSLKYHRLHPEYIYSRIRQLIGKYNLRLLLTMVDIQNHEESLKELSKTSLINSITIILCWSAQEAGRYLELYKTYEHAPATSIRAHQSTSYTDKMVEFITVPKSINKTDAVGLVSNFGSIRTAINARPEEVGLIAGWGEKKVQRWCNTVREPLRVKKAAKRGLGRDDSYTSISRQASRPEGANIPSAINPSLERSPLTASVTPDTDRRPPTRIPEHGPDWAPGEEEERAMLEAAQESTALTDKAPVTTSGVAASKRKAADDEPSEGIMAALAKLRQQ